MKTDQQSGQQQLVAPGWHLVLVLFALALLSVTGLYLGAAPFVLRYTILAARQILLLALVLLAVALRDLLGRLPSTWPATVRDAAMGIALAVVCWQAWPYLARVIKPPASAGLIPRNTGEIATYLLVAGLVAPFIEELVVRGYLQQQFSAITHCSAAGVALQAIVWGTVHGFLGWRHMLMIAGLGVPFGLLALWRRSLMPGIGAHCVFNIFVLMSWRA
ncbi:MAG: CPBP family intramembrane glutamic endopeptidase [Terriglobales bacterium]